jgi:hypothetical protein
MMTAEAESPRRRRRWLTVLRWITAGLVALLLLIQLVPYGRDHSNPPVIQDVVWDSPRTEELARIACYDCHSNETNGTVSRDPAMD